MSEEIKSSFFEIINVHKQLIKINKDKVPKHFLTDDFYDDTIEKLKTNGYKGDLLLCKYYILLNNVGKFINRYDIDISCIKKSTHNKINEECKLNAFKKAVYSKPEDGDDEIEHDETFANNIKEQYRLIELKKVELKNNKRNNSTFYNFLKNIIDISQNAITGNNNEIMDNTLKTLNFNK